MKDNDQEIAAINKQMNEMLENIRGINSKVENVISLVDDTNTKNLNEEIEKMLEKVTHSIAKQIIHEGIAQQLIDEGAFDVAKAYIDFLKARANRPLTVDKFTVSPTGKKTMKKNNGDDFGPDTKGTKISGIQEAIDKAAEKHKEEVPKDDDTGN